MNKTTASLQEMGLLGSAPATRRKATDHQLVRASLRENRDGLDRTRTRAEHLPSTAQMPISAKSVQTFTPLRAESAVPGSTVSPLRGSLRRRKVICIYDAVSLPSGNSSPTALEAIRFGHLPRFWEGTSTHSGQGEVAHKTEIWVKDPPSHTHTGIPLAQ